MIREGETLASVTDEFRKRVIAATLESEPTNASAARVLGITREGLYKLRLRYGLPIANQDERPIPSDWRERLK